MQEITIRMATTNNAPTLIVAIFAVHARKNRIWKSEGHPL